jgi:glycosyltransferase involved in cell wall biosynthesis
MRLDIVIPAHNEEARIDRTLSAYRDVVSEPLARFLVALDECTDGTAEVARSHAGVDARVEVHEYPKLGKGGVLMECFRRCDADVVGFVDADCATPPAEFLRLVSATSDADVAIASRGHPASVLPVRRSFGRRIASRAFAALTRALFGLPFADTQCGAKVARREVVNQALPLLSSRDFLFDVDLLLTAERLGFRIVEVPTVWVDQAGSHLSATADARRMAVSSLRLWLHHRVLPVGPSRRRPAPPSAPTRRPAVEEVARAGR